MTLVPGHVEELRKSGLTDETIAAAGLYSAPARQVQDLLGYGTGSAGLVFPYTPINGSAAYARVKLDQAGTDGKRYRSPAKQGNRLYVPPMLAPKILADVSTPLSITEGEKKALKAAQEGQPCIAVSGVWSWRTRVDGRGGAIADLDHVHWSGRIVYLIFDSDAVTNPKVMAAERAFAEELRRRGARVFAVRLPPGPNGAKVGLDDYLLTHSIEALCAIEPVEITDAAARNGHAVLVRLSDVQAEAVEWLWPHRIPRGKLTLLVGDPGLGKSYLLTDACGRISTGRPWPDNAPSVAGDCILLIAEDGLADTVRPRLDLSGGNATRVHILTGVQRERGTELFSLATDLVTLEAAIRETRAVFVGIDPLSSYLGDADSFKDSEIRGAVLTPLAALAERTRAAIVGVLHMTKDDQRRMIHRAQGSIAFTAVARAAHAVKEDPDRPERRLFVPFKSNLGPEPPALAFHIDAARGLVWDANPVPGPSRTLLEGDEIPTRSERRDREQAKTFLRDLLNGGPVSSKQVSADARANGIAERTLWRAKAELGVQAERATSAAGKPAGWYWFIPAEACQ